jgi:thioredoxin-like negative regulator of GroEL
MAKTIVYYSAAWCQPCKIFKPIVEKFVEDNAKSVHMVYVDIDKDPELALDDNVKSIPTIILFEDTKDGKPPTELFRMTGAKPRPYLNNNLLPLIQ